MASSFKMTEELHLKAARFHLRELEKYNGLNWDAESKTAADNLEKKAEAHQKCFEKHSKIAIQLRNKQ